MRRLAFYTVAACMIVGSLSAQTSERWFASTTYKGTVKRVGPFPTLDACEEGRKVEGDRLRAESQADLERGNQALEKATMDLRAGRISAMDATRIMNMQPTLTGIALDKGATGDSFKTDGICDKH